MRRRGPPIVILVSLLLFACGGEQVLGQLDGVVAPRCDLAYRQRTRVRIDAQALDETLLGFPLLVRLDPSSFDYAAAGPSGEGLSFTSPDCTVLAHEVATWDPEGTSTLWVRVPELAAGAVQDIFLFTDQVTPVDTSDRFAVFEDGFAAVYHLDGDPIEDSSPARRTGADRSTELVPGQIGGGRGFDGAAGIVISDAGFPEGLGARTACTWARSTNDGNAFFFMFSYGVGADEAGGFGMDRHGELLECVGGDGSRAREDGVFAAGDRSWRYVCCAYDGATADLYIDGVRLAPTAHDWPVSLASAQIGSSVGGATGGQTGAWVGDLDEVRVSDVSRSPDWIFAEYLTMRDDSIVTLFAAESL
ncbi:MAG: DUF2341 domain-containing protein [Sandaracinaceae bacterium]